MFFLAYQGGGENQQRHDSSRSTGGGCGEDKSDGEDEGDSSCVDGMEYDDTGENTGGGSRGEGERDERAGGGGDGGEAGDGL